MRIIKPGLLLSAYIDCFMIVESEEESLNRIFPDTAIVMAVRLKGRVKVCQQDDQISLPALSVTGLSQCVKLVHYEKQSGNILVRFRPGGAAAFFRQPVYELFNAHIPLDNFFRSSELELLGEQMAAAAPVEEKVGVIARFLQSKLLLQTPDLLLERAIEQIRVSVGLVRIKQLAASLHISQDAFEKRFRKKVGSSPKQYAGIVRLRSLIERGTDQDNLTDLALGAGFFDQSHFIREFKKMAGQTPSEFFNGSAIY